jgi:hypothetical protein
MFNWGSSGKEFIAMTKRLLYKVHNLGRNIFIT